MRTQEKDGGLGRGEKTGCDSLQASMEQQSGLLNRKSTDHTIRVRTVSNWDKGFRLGWHERRAFGEDELSRCRQRHCAFIPFGQGI